MIKKNIGTKDRIIRLVLALIFLGVAIWERSWIALAASLFTFYEAFMGWCILYQLLGINSCQINNKK